jgi:hypothetical protein
MRSSPPADGTKHDEASVAPGAGVASFQVEQVRRVSHRS